MANRRNNVDEFLGGKNHRAHNKRNLGNTQNHNRNMGQNGFRKINSEKDLHEMGIPDAKAAVKQGIIAANGSGGVQFIHGHTHGTAIQQWMRCGAVKQFLSSMGIIADVWWPDAKHTCVSFE